MYWSGLGALLLALAVMFGAFGGFILAIGLVMGFEYMDNRIKTPHELKTHLNLPFLGMLPNYPKPSGPVLVSNGAPPDFIEAAKAIRTNILFSSAHRGGRCLLVTSPGPSEGKSVVSSNLAITLAQAKRHQGKQ